MSIKLTFCTGVGTVTGANFLYQSEQGTKILIDCGLVQGERVALSENEEDFPYDPSSIDALVVTHAHLDHVGRIPMLVRAGFRGPIYSTPQTRALAELVLRDAVNILAHEARQDGREPLYDMNDVEHVFPLWKTIEYHTEFSLADDVTIYLKDAGHILGSSMVEVRADGKKTLFTGDVGNSPAPLLRDTEELGDIDYLVMESVYGDRNHESRDDRSRVLENIIKAALARGGTLVIPTFSIDRTQVLLYELNALVERKAIPSVPVFVDSPMGIRATEIYQSNTKLFNDAAQKQIAGGDDPFHFPRLEYTLSEHASRDIERMKGAKIILAGSGMSVGGRVISHEETYLGDPTSTILFVGYQAIGSLGRELAEGAKKVRIHHKTIKVRAHIETIYGYSAHKDSDHLLAMVATATDKLKEVFVVMGEPGASMHMAQRINDELGIRALVPERKKEYQI